MGSCAWIAVAAALVGCGGDAPGAGASSSASATSSSTSSSGAGGAGGGAPLASATFTPSDAAILNPERGFYDNVDLVGGGDMAFVRAAGRTLAYANVRLDAYRDAPLDAPLLDALDAGFAAARAARIELVLRFVYNDAFDADAPKDRILGHLAQLAPVLAKNADVVAVMQAGFVGAWGEWHSSTNGLTDPGAAADRAAIVAGILAALPVERATQIRTPMLKDELFPGGPIDEAAAFSGQGAARVGHHDDCFLAGADDMGTYADPIDTWKAYVAAEGRFVPVGGETCATDPPRTDCAAATTEMAAHHWSFLNALYHPDVLDGWKTGGCYDAVAATLGYRLRLVDASWSEAVAPAGVVHVVAHLENVGWAAPFNPRGALAVLSGASGRWVAALPTDPRRWEPGAPITIDAALRVPADVPPGTYRLAIWLPDAAPSLRDVPEYAIQLANESTWDAVTGDNVVTEAIAIDPGAPGPVDPSAPPDFAAE